MHGNADFLHVFFAGHVMCIALFAEMHGKNISNYLTGKPISSNHSTSRRLVMTGQP